MRRKIEKRYYVVEVNREDKSCTFAMHDKKKKEAQKISLSYNNENLTTMSSQL